MIKSFIFKLTIMMTIWAINSLYCYSSCQLSMKGLNYFINVAQDYKVQMEIESLCAKRLSYKRELKSINLNIYKGDQLIEKTIFQSGLWMPSQGKFFFKYDSTSRKRCFKGAKTLMIDLDKKIINSINGHFLNLSNGNSYGLDCKV